VKLADLIANGWDVAENPLVKWSDERRAEYRVWARKVAAGCRGLNPQVDVKFAEMVGWDACSS